MDTKKLEKSYTKVVKTARSKHLSIDEGEGTEGTENNTNVE